MGRTGSFAASLPPLRRLATVLVGVGTAHAAVQAVGVLVGFLTLRWLSVDDFAQYTLAFAYASTMGALFDLGATGAILALVGTRQSDSHVVGRYIAAASQIRTLLLAVGVPVGLAVFWVASARTGWSPTTKAALFAAVVLALAGRMMSDFYSTPLEMQGRYRQLYRITLTNSVGRLAATAAGQVTAVLSGVMASFINSIGQLALGIRLRRGSSPLLVEPADSVAVERREIIVYMRPLVLGGIFAAFQSQITIFLASLFGGTTEVAELGALSRLGALFLIPAALNSVLLAPYLARQPADRAKRTITTLILLLVAFCIGLTAIGSLFRSELLWLLGFNYRDLDESVPLVLAASAANYAGLTIFTINSVRRWIYWWSATGTIVAVIATQALTLTMVDPASTHGLLVMALASALVTLSLTFAATAWGLTRKADSSVS